METHNFEDGLRGKNVDLASVFALLYDKYYQKIYNYAYERLLHREAAEDVTENIFLAVLRNLSTFDARRGSFKTWLLAIARNQTQNYCLKAYVRQEIPVERVDENLASVQKAADMEAFGWENDTLNAPVSRRARRILAALSDEEREFLTLRYVVGLTNGEIAELMGISANAISSRYSRLLEKCRRIDRNGASETPRTGKEG